MFFGMKELVGGENGSTHYSKGAKGQYTPGYFTNKSLDKGESMNTLCTLTPLSNSRWIKYIEFGKKKIMLSSSMSLGK
jgi:hypothetical protein